MKKIALLLTLSPLLMNAITQEDAAPSRVITYSITLCKHDAAPDEQAWKEMLERAAKVQKTKGSSKRQLKKISKAIKEMRETYDEEFFLTEVQVTVGDGICRCENKEDCQCLKKYKGVCPCATVAHKRCAGESSCCNKKK